MVHEYRVPGKREDTERLSSRPEVVATGPGSQVMVYCVMTPLVRSSGGGLHSNVTSATPFITEWRKS